MKKILSAILSVMFLNFMLYPAVIAEEAVQTANGEQAVASEYTISDSTEPVLNNSAIQSQDSQGNCDQNSALTNNSVINQAENNNNTQYQPVNSVQSYNKTTEHLPVKNNNAKKINVESVYIDSHGVEIPAQDILQVAFINDFNGRNAHIGDTIEFRFPSDIVTQEGTMIIPSTAVIIAEITDLKKPKPFHLSGKVYLNFKYIEINGTRKPIQAKLYSKKDYLSRKTLNKTVAVGETAITAGAGAAAGAAICAATAADAAVLVFGTAVTGGFGAIVGAAIGILLPGAAFKAKAGQKVNIELTGELDI